MSSFCTHEAAATRILMFVLGTICHVLPEIAA
jgi:hypothetical protein